jgi:hypothetical protein
VSGNYVTDVGKAGALANDADHFGGFRAGVVGNDYGRFHLEHESIKVLEVSNREVLV